MAHGAVRLLTRPIGFALLRDDRFMGSCLGLSMTHDIIVKQHGGRIDVDTEPGSFTEFIITLPRTVVPQNTAGSSN